MLFPVAITILPSTGFARNSRNRMLATMEGVPREPQGLLRGGRAGSFARERCPYW
jgi:hypothetical protein